MNKILSLFLLAFILLNTSISYAKDIERYTNIRIIPEKTFITPDSEIVIATEINLAPHWHVYWQNPGDSGLPVKIKWQLPNDFQISEISWPTPDKISYDILSNYGYYDQVILLQKLKAPKNLPEGKFSLSAKIDMLVCNEICIPESSEISITFNDGAINVDNSSYINAAQEKIAKPLNGEINYSESNNNLIINIKTDNEKLLNKDNLEFFPTEWGIINHLAEPKVSTSNNIITISHERGDRDLSNISALKGLLVIKGSIGKNQAFSINTKNAQLNVKPNINSEEIQAQTSAKSQGLEGENQINPQQNNKVKSDKVTWFSAIYLALLGGIILNLMPCVFPVLSMKALSLVKMGEKENKIARLHGLSYSFGVVLSFLVIGAILLILKEAGAAIGWGFQLQSPIIVALLAYLLFIIGLNLIGFFEIAGSFGNIGHKLTRRKSLMGSFFTGTLATIVATPCTAPFMGAAMGFAMTQSALISMSVFAALGFGLALPYLLLSYFPTLRKFLPKPGVWMETFKQFLAFPILASAIWLIWVLSQQSGSYGVLLVLLGMLAISFSIWLSHIHSKNSRILTRILLILSLSLPLFSLSYIKSTKDIVASSEKIYPLGEAFSNEKLSELLKGDNPIFVEMTAAWCITCKVNHAIAINTKATQSIFKENNVKYLIGDWTNKNNVITEYLNKFGRNGVPLYVFYGARDPVTKMRPDALLLPQVITTSIIKDTIEN